MTPEHSRLVFFDMDGTTVGWEPPPPRWALADERHDWWAGLPRAPWAAALVTVALTAVGPPRVFFLSRPTDDPRSYSGKAEWVKNHFPDLSGQLILTQHKHLLAGPGRVLVDDKPVYACGWEAAGGSFLLVPSVNNYRSQDAPDVVVRELRDILNRDC